MEAELCDAIKVHYKPQRSGGSRSSPLHLLIHSKRFEKLCFEFNTRFLHLAIGQQPYE